MFVYRYICKGDVVYVGIANDLKRRIYEHKHDKLQFLDNPVIEYFSVRERNDADILETYLINSYKTGRFFNVAKANRGDVSFLDNIKFPWIRYSESTPINEEYFTISQAPLETVIVNRPAALCGNSISSRLREIDSWKSEIAKEIGFYTSNVEHLKNYIEQCDGGEENRGQPTIEMANTDLKMQTHLMNLWKELMDTATSIFSKGKRRAANDILYDIDTERRKINNFYLLHFSEAF